MMLSDHVEVLLQGTVGDKARPSCTQITCHGPLCVGLAGRHPRRVEAPATVKAPALTAPPEACAGIPLRSGRGGLPVSLASVFHAPCHHMRTKVPFTYGCESCAEHHIESSAIT